MIFFNSCELKLVTSSLSFIIETTDVTTCIFCKRIIYQAYVGNVQYTKYVFMLFCQDFLIDGNHVNKSIAALH